MRDSPDGVAGPTAAVGVDAAKLDLRAWRQRLLRRTAISAANAGWIFLCMSGPGHAASPQSNTGGAALETALETFPGGSLRLLLPGTEPAIPRMPFAYGTIPGFEQPQDSSEGGFASSRFSIDVRQRLPRFLASFERAGQRSGVDWRLLAAMSYQESTWDPHAVSPTGVRGIMMLTLDTAEELEVDRDNPAQSIQGGAQYLGRILKHLPAGIHEPDRTNMALAAYNQGIGHLFGPDRRQPQSLEGRACDAASVERATLV